MPSSSVVVPVLLPLIGVLGAILLGVRVYVLVCGVKHASHKHAEPEISRPQSRPAHQRAAERQQQCADYRQQLIAAGIIHPASPEDFGATSVELASPTG